MDFRFGYNKEVFPLAYQPTTAAGAITVQDLTLSTELGAAPYHRVNPAWVRKFATTFSWYKGSLVDRLWRIPAFEGIHHGIERDSRSGDVISAVPFLDVLAVHQPL